MTHVVLFDLDGVIADWSHRLPLGIGTDEFYAAMPNDAPIEAGSTIFNYLVMHCAMVNNEIMVKNIGMDMMFVDILSCRPEKMRQTTVDWLSANDLFMPRNLHLRADNDDRPHWRIKLDMYEQFYKGKESVLVLFEDNAETIEVFRREGITCYQAQAGKQESKILLVH